MPNDLDKAFSSAFKKLKVSPSRSAKIREKHFYDPYSLSKRYSALVSKEVRPLSSNVRTAPRRPYSTKNPLSLKHFGSLISKEQPWGVLVSKTPGKPDIELFLDTTVIGKILQTIDVVSGERSCEFRESAFSSIADGV